MMLSQKHIVQSIILLLSINNYLLLGLSAALISSSLSSPSNNIVQNDASTYFASEDAEAYLDWFETKGGKHSYERSIFVASDENLNGENGVAIHWRIDNENESIRLAVAARADGWVGFGLSENGGMRGADIIYLTSEKPNELIDAYVMDDIYGGPIADDCQNWKLLNSYVDDGFIIFEAERLLNTEDNQDHQFFNDAGYRVRSTNIIAAWGDSSKIGYHRPHNRVKTTIRLFETTVDSLEDPNNFHGTMEKESDGYFEIRAEDYVITPDHTVYKNYCLSLADIKKQGVPIDESLHIIGLEPIINEPTKKYLHHYLLFGVPYDYDELAKNDFFTCSRFPSDETTVYAWAPGELALPIPPEAGYAFGQSADAGIISLRLEVHYNNVKNDDPDNLIDDSGVRIYYTRKRREHDIGVFQTGDPHVFLEGSRIGSGFSKHTFSCPSSCTSKVLPEDGITVIAENLHMHQHGISMSQLHMRNGETIRSSKIDHWDFDQAGNYFVQQQPYKILPGDSFTTSCDYYTANGDEVFGYSAYDEMCISFVAYYPKTKITLEQVPELNILPGITDMDFNCAYFHNFSFTCLAQYTAEDTIEPLKLTRKFGKPSDDGVCHAPLPPPIVTDASSSYSSASSKITFCSNSQHYYYYYYLFGTSSLGVYFVSIFL